MELERHILTATVLLLQGEDKTFDEDTGLIPQAGQFLDFVRRTLSAGVECKDVVVESVELFKLIDEPSDDHARVRRIEYNDGEWFEIRFGDGISHVKSSLSEGTEDPAEFMLEVLSNPESSELDNEAAELLAAGGNVLAFTRFDQSFEQFVFSSLVTSVHEVLLEHVTGDELLLSDQAYLTRLHDLVNRVRKYQPEC